MKTEILILDYNRPTQLYVLLQSLKKNIKFDHKVVVLNNGSDENYADQFKEEGLVDKVINNKINVGCGLGTIQLFAQCESEFAFYVQVDHELQAQIGEDYLEAMKNCILLNGYFYVDLAGNQGQGQYSERAQFIRKQDYLSMNISAGGPGPLEDLKWSEESIQDYMKKNDKKFVSLYNGNNAIFKDCGWDSVRENPDGAKWLHYPDTKVLKCLEPPTEKFSFPPLNEEEWELALNGKWPYEGIIPESWADNSFEVWNKLPS